MDFFVHPTAVIDDGAVVGAGTQIWHFSHLMPECEIGENCKLGQNVFVGSGVKLGKGCKVQNNVSLYSGVICEEEVFLGPSAVFTNVKNPRAAINRRDEYLTTYLERGVTVGANAVLVCGVRLGAYAFVGAGTVVTHDLPPHALVVGNPGRQIGWMSAAGGRLEFDPQGRAVCPESGQEYRLVNGKVFAQ